MLVQENIVNQTKTKPRVSFLGAGWIGLHRMYAIQQENAVEIAAIADINEEKLSQAKEMAPGAKLNNNLQELIQEKPEGIVIATPSALHASQTIAALEKGISVFCQKPLGRNLAETCNVVETAKRMNKLLAVDFCYRYTHAMQAIYKIIKNGELGKIYTINLVFHNAYGPDKEWFYNPTLSGGGCVIDLGSHLVDLALWVLGFPKTGHVTSNLYANGIPVTEPEKQTEDFATASFCTNDETLIQLSCSWNLHAGQEAIIEATFYGTKGTACFHNINGSFYDFEAYRSFSKTKKEIISVPPDNWGGRAAVRWAQQLSCGEGFNEEAYELIDVAEVIDKIYKRLTIESHTF